MLTKDEIEQLKDAASHPRDKMILMLLLYTGMRSNAARTLRVKDIDLEEGTYRFNPNVDHGLKGADDRNGSRPMLLATGAVRQWINNYHPARHRDDFEECFLITAKPNYSTVRPREAVGHNCLRYVLGTLKEKTGLDKPLNPHALRHNFVTICKRDYDMDNDTIKWLIGHTKDSRVMETTYSHLSDMDFRQRAEEKAGVREPTERSTLTPKTCDCGEKVASTAKACSNCGMLFTPDARAVNEQVHQDIGAERALADGEELTEADLETIAADDALLAKLIEIRSDQK